MNVRNDFPILSCREGDAPLIYFDSAATSQHPVQVLEAVRRYYSEDNANPHRGVYGLAMRADEAHDGSRERIARFLGASSDELVFVQNATEGLNLAAYSYGMNYLKPGDEIVISIAEHHSNMVPWQRVAKATGAVLKYMYVNAEGMLTDGIIDEAIGPKTKVVAVGHVSNVLGLVVPVKKIVDRAHSMGAVVVLDAAQSIPHMKVDFHALDVDFMAFSGHKMYGPMGSGGVCIRKSLLRELPPFMSGGDMIGIVEEQSATYAEGPRKFEAGTRNVGGEVGLAAAAEYLENLGWEAVSAHEEALMKLALEGMTKLPYIEIYGKPDASLRRGVIAFNVKDVHPHDVATILDAKGICIRAGHHCAQPLMEYLGVHSTSRISFGVYNTEEEVETFLAALPDTRRWMGLSV